MESRGTTKKLLIFMRPCDVHAKYHQEKIYLQNGGFEDSYYKRMNERVKNCFDGMQRRMGYLFLCKYGD